jgi:hypothetical protein
MGCSDEQLPSSQQTSSATANAYAESSKAKESKPQSSATNIAKVYP